MLGASMLLMIGWGIGPSPAAAQFKYSPDDLEVMNMVERGIGFIQAPQNRSSGALALSAIAICEARKRYQGEVPTGDPLVQKAIGTVEPYTLNADGNAVDDNALYEPCVSAILLGIVDPVKYAPNIKAVLSLIERRQIPTGSWAYKENGPTTNLGDTSQTQYCCLAIWFAAKAGYQVDPQVIGRAMDWLMKTQTVNGGWIYRQSVANQRPAGGNETLSITAAGAGGMLMLLDTMDAKRFLGPRGAKLAGPDLPKFVSEYVAGAEENEGSSTDAAPTIDVPRADVMRCLTDANQFFAQHFVANPEDWTCYYLYGFERYAYFRELFDGQVREVPDWYDQGVEFLKATQNADGSWHGTGGRERGMAPSVTTSFAVLFLVRSTELLANDPGKGSMFGGSEIPRGKITQRGQSIVGEALNREVDDFLDLVAAGDDNIEEFADSLTTIVLPTDPAKRELYLGKLRVLISDPDAYKRLVAVKALAASRDMNNIPALLMAMKDEEPEIKKTAHQGLRFITRKMDSIKLPDNPDESDFIAVRQQWIDWYRSVRPDDRQVID